MTTEENDILDYEHFLHTLRALGAKMYHAPALHVALLKAWDEPHRIFHGREHLRECLFHLEQERWGGLIDVVDRGLLTLAIWFHDAVYDVKAPDNEEKSTAWAMQSLALLDLSPDNLDTVRHLILSTKLSYTRTDCPLEAWIHDIDLHVFGCSFDRFAQYTQDIRKEFAWVDDLNYRRGSDLVLRRLVNNPLGIYRTEAGRLDYEDIAHQNINMYLQSLQNLQMVLEVPNSVEQ
jgi:predicted metal-dependent HD superfamily phosphohydrolase